MISADDYEGWAQGDVGAFERCRSALLNEGGRLADRFLIKVTEQADGILETFYLGNPDYVRAAAIEDLDCKVSRGKFMVGRRSVPIEIRLGEAKETLEREESFGKETGRLLDPGDFNEVNFVDVEKFHALFRGILRRHCLKELRECMCGTKINESQSDISKEPDPADLGQIRDEHASQDIREELVAGFAQFSELLRINNQRAAAQTADEVAASIKSAEDWDADHYDFWKKIGKSLALRGDALAKRKDRFYELLVDYREHLPKPLVLCALKLLASDAEFLLDDCSAAKALVSADLRIVLGVVRDFLLSSLAAQHPDYKNTELTVLRELRAGLLLRQGNRVILEAWPPDGREFTNFCRQNGLLTDNPAGELRRLLLGLRQATPFPRRLVGTLTSIFTTAEAAGGEKDGR